MDIEKLIERLGENTDCWTDKVHGYADLRMEAATALSTIQAENEKLLEKMEDARLEGYAKGLGEMSEENEKLRSELEQVKRERDAAVDCIYQIEDDLDRGNDNDWAREHIAEWESQKEDGHGTALQNDTLCV